MFSIPFVLIFIAGVIFAWIIYKFWGQFTQSTKAITGKISEFRDSISTSIEDHYRNDIYRYTQYQHIASSLFSLDEIAIEPRVLTPLVQSIMSSDSAPTDCVSLSVPYTPDWPELAAIYNASTMSIIDAVLGGGNIILAGHAGSGKSFALAWLAARLSRKENLSGRLANLVPIYINATDILAHLNIDGSTEIKKDGENSAEPTKALSREVTSRIRNKNDSVDLLVQALSSNLSPLTISRLPRYIRSILESHHAILLIDRADELPPLHARIITEYIRLLLEYYPKLQIITAISFDDLAGLPLLGFSLLGMAPWGESERTKIVHQWKHQWFRLVQPGEKSQPKLINPNYVVSWLKNDVGMMKPLEVTLKTWASLSGDVIGQDGTSAIEAYIRRMTGSISRDQQALEQFALQMLVDMTIASNPHNPDRLRKEYKSELEKSSTSETAENSKISQALPVISPKIIRITDLESLTKNGLLIAYPDSNYGFSHPIITGYLAGKALSRFGVTKHTQEQPSWMGKTLALYYLAKYADVSSLISYYLHDDDIIHTNHLHISRWLQIAPKNKAWRTIVLRTLVTVLQKEQETTSLSAKIITALVLAGDAGIPIYFKQLIQSGHPMLRQLAALGCGALKDSKSVDDLTNAAQSQSPYLVGSACLALAAIGDSKSLEILASYLLTGNETVRRYAAEALANDSREGHPALKDGSSMDDLLIRRSVIYGLIRINEPWARKIVENLQLEDNEWVVRNAAIQAFDELTRTKKLSPTLQTDLTEVKWLIDYTNRIGKTLAPGNLAEEIVIKALNDGKPDEKIFAVEYAQKFGDPSSTKLIHSIYKNSTGELRDAAYFTLWILALSGVSLPMHFE